MERPPFVLATGEVGVNEVEMLVEAVPAEPGAGAVVGSGYVVVPTAGESKAKMAASIASHATEMPSFGTT